MSDPNTNGSVEFIDGWPPPLEAGNYKLKVTQTVSHSTDPAFSNTYQFSVAAPRFTLDPSLIHSFYPPAAHQANFSNLLPQIVFTRKTLPWERTLDDEDSPDRGTLAPPWLGILLFDADDLQDSDSLVPKVESRTVGELISSSNGGTRPATIFGPAIVTSSFEPGQSIDDKCMTIDVNSALFQSIAPSLDDLPYLTHARLVDPSLKTVPNSVNEDGWVSLVIGNRFPKPGTPGNPCQNSAFLVSYEGFASPENNTSYLHGGTAITEETTRLVCLASWTFNDVGTVASFKQLMNGLTTELATQSYDGQLSGRMGMLPTTAKATEGANQEVQQALLQGFIALDHTTRQGEKTVSWNRGPLVPLQLTAPDTAPQYSSSDAALRYNPASGMFDVSYAAAWQLGRMLALNSKKFSIDLLNWRRSNQQSIALALTRQLFYKNLGGLLTADDSDGGDELDEQHLKHRLLQYIANHVVGRLAPEHENDVGVLGKLGDPSGLRSPDIPYGKLRAILDNSNDPVGEIHNLLQGDL